METFSIQQPVWQTYVKMVESSYTFNVKNAKIVQPAELCVSRDRVDSIFSTVNAGYYIHLVQHKKT
jgi:hypothetical protein